MIKSFRLAAVAVAAMLAAGAAQASVSDPLGDFLATYAGPHGGDLDILSASASFDGASFHLSSTEAAAIGTTANSLFVWGINRGAGTERLQTQGAPPAVGAGVAWDAVAVLFPDGTSRVVTLPTAGPPTITPLSGAVAIAANTISAVIPLALLPSTGFAPQDYTFTLWTRDRVNPGVDGTNAEIADFAPNASGFKAAIPEPATWSLMLSGFGLVGWSLRRGTSRRLSRA